MNKINLQAVLQLNGVQINPAIFQKISRQTASLPANLQNVQRLLGQINGSAQTVGQSIGTIKQQLTASEKVSNLFVNRMAQFAVLLPIFSTLNKNLQGGVKYMADFEHEIRRIIALDPGKLGDKFDVIAKSALEIGQKFNQSSLEVVSSIKIFAQAGRSLTESIELANTAALAAQVTTLDLAQAQELLISTTQVFSREGVKAAQVLDAISKAEDISASDAIDFYEAFRTGGNALEFATESLEDTIGLIAGLREQSRKSGSEIGTFFKTISTRILAAGDSKSALEGLGVQVQNVDGSLRPLLAILNDTKVAFDGLSESEQVNAAKTIAGVRQFESFIATLSSLDKANQVSAEASNSAGRAEEKRAIIAESLKSKLEGLQVAFEGLVNAFGNAGLQDFFKDALKFGTLLLKTLGGAATLIDQIGGSITPILGLFAVKAAKNIFGLGGGASGVGAINSPQIQATNTNTQALNLLTASVGKLTLATTNPSIAAKVAQTNPISGTGSFVNARPFSPSIATGQGRFQSARDSLNTGASKIGDEFNKLNGTVKLVGTTLAGVFIAGPLSKIGGVLGEVSSTALQTGLSFSNISGKAGILAGTLTLAADTAIKFAQAVTEHNKAIDDQTKTENRSTGINQISKLGGTNFGTTIVDNLTSSIKQYKTSFGKDFIGGINDVFNDAFRGEAGGKLREFGLGVKDFQEIIANPQFIQGLANNKDAIFANEEALTELKGSFDENGKATKSSAELLKLLYQALGVTAGGISEAIKQNKYLFKTLEDINQAQENLDLVSTFDALDAELKTLNTTAGEVTGIDKLRQTFELLDGSIEGLISKREALSELGKLGKLAGFTSKEFAGVFNELQLLLKLRQERGAQDPDVKDSFKDFFGRFTEEQNKSLQEFLKIDDETKKKTTEKAKAKGAVEQDIIENNKKRTEELFKVTQDADAAAQDFSDGLAKISTKLTPDFLKELLNVKPEDISKVLGERGPNKPKTGEDIPEKSKLSSRIKGIIVDSFDDGLGKAKQGLESAVQKNNTASKEFEGQIADITKRIEAFGNPAKDTTAAREREQLVIERSSILIKKKHAEDEGSLGVLQALLKVGEQERKAKDREIEATQKYAKELNEAANAQHDFKKSINDSNREFEQFKKQKIEDLLAKQAAAAQELGQATGEVISATSSVSDAYKEFKHVILDVNGAFAEAQITSNHFGRDIKILNGSIVGFDDRLSSLNKSFTSVLQDANITVQKRIELERQLANETLAFLQQAQSEISGAGTTVFGQSSQENQQLGKGIAGLTYVAQQLGGSFKNFLSLNGTQINQLGEKLLNLPVEFRQSILSALSSLPSTVSIGGFSVDQLKQAIGQVGAGVSDEAGLPSLEELTNQQVEQLKSLQGLAMQDAQTQLVQVIAAQQQLDAAKQQLDVAKIGQDRAAANLEQVSADVSEERAVLEFANQQRQELLTRLISTNDANVVRQIENEAGLFAEQNKVFYDVGKEIVAGIGSIVNAKLTAINTQTSVNQNPINQFNYATSQLPQNFSDTLTDIPSFANGNLSPREAAGLLNAAAREKRAMPAGAGLAVANTSEAIIPMRNKGFIPNFADGSPIAAGVEAVRTLNQSVVAAISASITEAIGGSSNNNNAELLSQTNNLLTEVRDQLRGISETNVAIQTNTASSDAGSTATAQPNARDVRIVLETNQNNTIQVTGLDKLREQLAAAVRDNVSQQTEQQLEPLLAQIDSVITVLRQRGLLSSFGQAG